MENAHLRMGKLKFIKQTRDAITEVTVNLDQLIAEVPPERGESAFHLVSVFGGDQEVAAVIAAAQEGLRFQVEWQGRQIIGTLGEKPAVFRASLQIPGRKRPVRHAVLISTELAETTLGAEAEARRTILNDCAPEFVLHRLAIRFGLPVLPEWAGWFRKELDDRGLIEPLLGIKCHAVAVKGTKIRLLRILSQGLRRRQISMALCSAGATP